MQSLELEVFSISPIIGQRHSCSSVACERPWMRRQHFPLPLRWSPLSWPQWRPNTSLLDPRRTLEDPPRPLPWGSSWDPERSSFVAILTSAGCHCIHATVFGVALILQRGLLGAFATHDDDTMRSKRPSLRWGFLPAAPDSALMDGLRVDARRLIGTR